MIARSQPRINELIYVSDDTDADGTRRGEKIASNPGRTVDGVKCLPPKNGIARENMLAVWSGVVLNSGKKGASSD